MKKQSFFKNTLTLIPLLISGLLFVFLTIILQNKTETGPDFIQNLENKATFFISLSGILSLFIVLYLLTSTIIIKNQQLKIVENLSKVTEKMHNFRRIIELLVNSKMWLPEMKETIDEEYAGLSYFDVKEFYKGNSKLAIDFLQENHHFGDTENLYLELKSLLITKPREKRTPKTLYFPKIYGNTIVEKWLEHKCGSGLIYYFGYKYGLYKDTLDYNKVFERNQEKIIMLANTIDSNAFEDSSFNDVFLSKLGDYISHEVLPKLHLIKQSGSGNLPKNIFSLCVLFISLTIFGVLMPLCYLLLSLPAILLTISFSFVISIIFFITIAIYPFLNKEINS